MDDFPASTGVADDKLEKDVARQVYERLRKKLVALKSDPERNTAEIDALVQDLEKAQLAFKATYGLLGNNPIED